MYGAVVPLEVLRCLNRARVRPDRRFAIWRSTGPPVQAEYCGIHPSVSSQKTRKAGNCGLGFARRLRTRSYLQSLADHVSDHASKGLPFSSFILRSKEQLVTIVSTARWRRTAATATKALKLRIHFLLLFLQQKSRRAVRCAAFGLTRVFASCERSKLPFGFFPSLLPNPGAVRRGPGKPSEWQKVPFKGLRRLDRA